MKSSTYIPLIIIGALIIFIGCSIALVKLGALELESTETTPVSHLVLFTFAATSLVASIILTLRYLFITPKKQAMSKKEKEYARYDTMNHIRGWAIAIVVVLATIAGCIIAKKAIAAFFIALFIYVF